MLLSLDACDSLVLLGFGWTARSHGPAPLSYCYCSLATTVGNTIVYYRLVAINLTLLTVVVARFMIYSLFALITHMCTE